MRPLRSQKRRVLAGRIRRWYRKARAAKAEAAKLAKMKAAAAAKAAAKKK